MNAAATPAQAKAAPEQELVGVLRRLSHEIRNPLASLKAGIQLLQRLTRPEGEIADYFSSLLTQVARIDRIMDGVHALARLDTGEPRPVELEDAVGATLGAWQGQARRAGLTLSAEAGPAARVQIDPENLQMALAELVSNAVQVSPAGAGIVVSWEPGPDGLVRLNVDDEGPGITPENAEKILRPFHSTQAQGRGLGLSMVTRICALAGGRMEWRNLPHGGCRFSLLLPPSS